MGAHGLNTCFAAMMVPVVFLILPVSAHARFLVAARAVLIALTAAGASPASTAIVRETVGSEDINPSTDGPAVPIQRSGDRRVQEDLGRIMNCRRLTPQTWRLIQNSVPHDIDAGQSSMKLLAASCE